MIIRSFLNKMNRLGIEIELTSNIPWIYLNKVNGVSVKERSYAEHGFCAFLYPVSLNGVTRWSNRRKVFQKVREMLK